MAETYDVFSGKLECPECEDDLVLLDVNGKARIGCPTCIPDGLLESYIIDI